MVVRTQKTTINAVTGTTTTVTTNISIRKGSKLLAVDISPLNVSRGPVFVTLTVGDTTASNQVALVSNSGWVRSDANGITDFVSAIVDRMPTDMENSQPFIGVRARNDTGTNAALLLEWAVEDPG